MGVSVREKKPGEWWVFISRQGKRTSRKIGTDKKTAMEVAKKIEAKLVLTDFHLAQREKVPTFKEYAEQWLETYIKATKRLSTYRRYREVLKHVYPDIGNLPIDKIKRGNVRDLLLKLGEKKGLSKSTLSLAKDVVSGPLSYAMDAELILVNPTIGLTKHLQIQRNKQEHLDPLNHEEVNLFLKTCLKMCPEHYPFFLCAFRTGMRLGELLALHWGDVDWNRRFLRVERSYKLKQVTQTKNGRARRVDMSDQLIEVLRNHFTRSKEEGLKLGLGSAPELVFHRKEEPIEQNHIRRIFKRILERAGLREIRIHDIRHTYASLLLSEGISPVYVKEQLGHSSIQMTVDIYGTWIPNSNRAAVNRLDTLSADDRKEKTEERTPETDSSTPHPNAPQAHPPEMKKPQPMKIAALS
jgi:integrase